MFSNFYGFTVASEISRELQQDLGRPSYTDSADNISEDSVNEYDLLQDADKDKNIVRTKVKFSYFL